MDTTASIYRAIAYFDVFRYPLTVAEIHAFMDRPADIRTLEQELRNLVITGKVFDMNGYYSLHNNRSLVSRRLEGNQRAVALLRIAQRVGRLLYRFPFVRAVGISGSLSKNYAEEDADIDFFIITRRNRLWIARTFLHVLKKLSFLAGKQHWYCMNYFVDEDALLIAEQNVFTATEVVTLKPVSGVEFIHSFYTSNSWTSKYLPNHPVASAPEAMFCNPWYKRVVEALLNGPAGNWLDERLMKITAKRWARKEASHKINSKGQPLALVAGKHLARPHPGHLQRKILLHFAERLESMEDHYTADISFSEAK